MTEKLRLFQSWLEDRGVDVDQALERALGDRNLPTRNRRALRQAVVLGLYLSRAARELRRVDWENEQDSAEGRLFQLAVLLVNEGAFEKRVPSMCSLRRDQFGNEKGDAESFAGYVTDACPDLSRRFLEAFKPERQDADFVSIKYLQVLSVSRFLTRVAILGNRVNQDGVLGFLRRSRRVRPRTKLAYKLVYFPLSLNKKERETIEREYGWKPHPYERQQVQIVAEKLGFKNANALSRKLYKVRAFAEREAERRFRRALKRRV